VTGNPEESLGILLADVTRLFWRRLETGLATAGLDLTAGEARVMITLEETPGSRQAQLAERMHIEPMTLVGFLDRLEGRAMVRRVVDPSDRRAKLVEPTDLGRRTTTRIRAVSAEVRQRLVTGLEVGETALLRSLLQRLRGNLVGDGCPGGRT
jgi:DNA-binding MarR family transcriptional regulator